MLFKSGLSFSLFDSFRALKIKFVNSLRWSSIFLAPGGENSCGVVYSLAELYVLGFATLNILDGEII